MNFILSLLVLFLILNVESITNAFDSTWPKIQSVSTSSSGVPTCSSISPSFTITCESSDPLTNFLMNRTEMFLKTLSTEGNGITSLKIQYLTKYRYFGFDILDGEISTTTHPYEYYELKFNGLTAQLLVYHVLGIIRGLQTFEQIVHNAINDGSLSLCDYKSTIVDFPRYRYRGIMIDTARNFYTVERIKEIIRNMYLAKYTVFHWHMTDSQSLPFKSTKFSKLVNGSFNQNQNQYYTKEQVEDLRIFAFLYGIEIVIEVDLPSHSYSFSFGYPSLLPSNQTDCFTVSRGCTNRTHPCSMTLPESNQLFDLVDNIINETSTNHLTNFFSMGMDEFAVYCWENEPIYQNLGLGYCEGMYDKLLFDFVNRYIDLLKTNHSLQRIAYDDIFLTFPNPGNGGSICEVTKTIAVDDLIVLVWGGSSHFLRSSELRPHEVIQEAVNRGHRVIAGNYERMYFGTCSSRITGGDQGYYKGIFPDTGLSQICSDPWKRYWMYDLTDGVIDSNGKILGGEGLLWETHPNDALGALGFESGWSTDGHQGYFISERLWSSKSERTETLRLEAKERIEMFTKIFRDARLTSLTQGGIEGLGKQIFLGEVLVNKTYWERPQVWVEYVPSNDISSSSVLFCDLFSTSIKISLIMFFVLYL